MVKSMRINFMNEHVFQIFTTHIFTQCRTARKHTILFHYRIPTNQQISSKYYHLNANDCEQRGILLRRRKKEIVCTIKLYDLVEVFFMEKASFRCLFTSISQCDLVPHKLCKFMWSTLYRNNPMYL